MIDAILVPKTSD